MQSVPQIQEVTDTREGKEHILSNINVLSNISQILSTTLGPFGRDKLFISRNNYLVTNDGITILNKLALDHPVQKLLRNISKSQEEEIGDGTTSVVLLSIEILENLRQLIKDDVPTKEIIEALEISESKIFEYLKTENKTVQKIEKDQKIQQLKKIIETTLSSKIISSDKKFFSELLAENICNEKTFVTKKQKGGFYRDSVSFKGVVLEKGFCFAGHEQLPKKIEQPKVLLLDEEIELSSLRENAKIKLDKTELYKEFIDAEHKILMTKLENIKNSGANVILSTRSIGDYATQYFAKNNIFCMGRVSQEDIDYISEFSNCVQQVSFENFSIGQFENFEERKIGEKIFYFLEAKKETNFPITLILRGAGDEILNEVERSLDDVVLACNSALRCEKIVRGGGSFEIEMGLFLREISKSVEKKFRIPILKIAQSFDVIPVNLAKNFGLDSMETLKKMRYEHVKNNQCSVSENGTTTDENIYEPYNLKENILKASFSFAKTVLKINSSFVIKKD